MGKETTKVSLKALRKHRYAGRDLEPGDIYEAIPSHALALRAAKTSELAEEQPETKRTYRRRDMVAE